MAAAIALVPIPAEARQSSTVEIDIAAGDLPRAIAELAREAGVSIGTEGRLPHISTPAVRGRMTVDAALSRLLANSGYVARRVGDRAWRIERNARPPVTNTANASAHPVQVVESQPIVVTGSKRALVLSQLPMAASIVSLDDIHLAGAADGSASIVSLTEGLALSRLGPGRNRMFLRGVADSAFNGESQSTVAVVVDESRVTYAAPDPDLRLVDVERVEVLKGPQGSLYGTGALGGIYRVVTRKPDYDSTNITGTASSEATAKGGLGYSAAVTANLPLVPGNAALRVVSYSGRDAGWIETGDRSNSNVTQVIGGRATMGVMLADDWELQAGGLIQLLDSHDTQYVYAPAARKRPSQLPEPHDNDLRHGYLRLAGKIGNVHLLASSGYTSHEVRDELDATIGASQFGLANPQIFKDDRQFRVWDSELRANGHLGAINWLAGVTHIEARQTFLTTLVGTDASGAASLVLDDDRRASNDNAIYADLSLPLLDHLRLEAGGRLFESAIVESSITDLGLVSRELTKRGLTPSLSIAWTPRDSRLLFLRYGSAFRPGGADIASDGSIEALGSDELATIEAGWREKLPGGGSVEIGAYYSRWDHIQSDVLQPDGLLESENIGNGEIFGFEFTGSLPMGENWRLDAGANFTHAALVTEALDLQLDDRHLPIVPEYTLRSALVHSFTLAGEPATIVASLRYVGPARLSFDPAIDRPMGKVLESTLAASARLAGFNLTLGIENLFDRKSDTFAYGNPLRFSTMRQYTPQAPLTVRLTVQKAL